MNSIDINELDRLEQSFTPTERRQINRCCEAIESMLASSRVAFDTLGSPVDDANADGQMHTAFITAITPALLESASSQVDGLRAFFHAEWRKATGTRSRVLARAECDCEQALAAIQMRLAELEPAMNEQTRLLGQLEHALLRLQQATKEH